jgi:NADH-quinone oxidoreductase subunit G
MLSHLTVHEPPPPPDPDTPLGFSMEGYRGPLPSPLIPQVWAPGWNSIQAVNKYQDEVGGPLREEMPGLRLIEPVGRKAPSWFTAIPRAFQPTSHQWLLLPLTALFGSEELSNQSPAIVERISEPFLSLHPSDGARLSLDDQTTIELTLQGTMYRLAVRLEPSTPAGTAGISLGPDVSDVRVPVWIDLFKAIKAGHRRRVA